MASTGDDSDTSSLVSSASSLNPPAVVGAENDTDQLQAAQQNLPNLNQETESVSGNDDEDQDSDDYDRENRFQGPTSNWRYFTENERSLAKSLDQQRANDLSITLYNVHALKARVRDPEAAAKVKPYHSKKRWLKPKEDGTLPWQPPVRWTAWPLRPRRVPRSGERFGVPPIPDGLEKETYRKIENWKPSGTLEDEILATVMRKVKMRLRDIRMGLRSTAVEDVEVVEQPPDKHLHGSVDGGSDADISIGDMSEDSDEVLSVKRRLRSALAPPLDEGLLVDDEAARTLLQPKIRHVLSQLDGLLLGLHKSRRGQTRSNSRSRSRTPRSRSTSRAAKSSSRSKSKPWKPSSDISDEASNDNETDTREVDEQAETENDRPKRRRRRRRRLKPRDWSEVLGMAGFTSWDPKVIDRAAKRCAALFGEGMDFKIVPLHSVSSAKSKSQTYGSGIDTSTVTVSDDGFIVDDRHAANWCYCPVLTCARHEKPFEQTWRWREHMKRTHKYNDARLGRLEAQLNRKDEPGSVPLDQGEGAEVQIRAKENQPAAAASSDAILQPIDIRMGRGRDKQPRREVYKPVSIESDREEEEEMED